MPSGPNPVPPAPAVGGLFFPQSKYLGIDLGSCSPEVLERVIYAGTHNPSYAAASDALLKLGDLSIPTKQVERLTRRIGTERCAERDIAVKSYHDLPLVERKSVPVGVTAPDVGVVQMDGGRLQILDRTAATPTPAGVSHWREDKVGWLASMTSDVSPTDPSPIIPSAFVDPTRIVKLTRQIKGSTGVEDDTEKEETDKPLICPAVCYQPPELVLRSVLATRQEVHEFGQMLAEAAWSRGFYGADRRAYVGDGQSANWGVWERHFSNFVPILDFIHALSYVFHAAMAGQSFEVGWTTYTDWIQQVWAGEIEPVIAEVAKRAAQLGAPGEEESETSPRNRVAEALSYLQNQKDRMRYAEYRRAGLPITSSHIESTIKLVNRRVKGTEKFWSEDGAEAILQLRADALSETEPMEDFWKRREASATGQRRYSLAA